MIEQGRILGKAVLAMMEPIELWPTPPKNCRLAWSAKAALSGIFSTSPK